MEDLILVYYADFNALSNEKLRQEIHHEVEKVKKEMGFKFMFVLPTSGEARLECINPRYISDNDEVEKLKSALETAQELLLRLGSGI